jgi:hypothetical protein
MTNKTNIILIAIVLVIILIGATMVLGNNQKRNIIEKNSAPTNIGSVR